VFWLSVFNPNYLFAFYLSTLLVSRFLMHMLKFFLLLCSLVLILVLISMCEEKFTFYFTCLQFAISIRYFTHNAGNVFFQLVGTSHETNTFPFAHWSAVSEVSRRTWSAQLSDRQCLRSDHYFLPNLFQFAVHQSSCIVSAGSYFI
jgi:hypothetical protein